MKHIKTISNRVLKDTMKHGTAAAANARPHASLPAKPAAAWPTRSVRIRITK